MRVNLARSDHKHYPVPGGVRIECEIPGDQEETVPRCMPTVKSQVAVNHNGHRVGCGHGCGHVCLRGVAVHHDISAFCNRLNQGVKAGHGCQIRGKCHNIHVG